MAKEHFTTMELKSPSGFSYCAYDNIKDSSILKGEHIGKRVMVAGYKGFFTQNNVDCIQQNTEKVKDGNDDICNLRYFFWKVL